MMTASNADEFYRWRNDRTDRIAENQDYQRIHVRLVAAPATTKTYAGQVQLLLAANMLSRWCRTLEFGFTDVPLLLQLQLLPGMTLHQRIAAETQAADPFGNFVFRPNRSNRVQYTLKIGSTSVNEPVNFTVDSDGWLVCAGRGDCSFVFSHAQHNPVGPALAACVGVADAFKVATKQPSSLLVERFVFSAFDLQMVSSNAYNSLPMPERLYLGNVQIIGIGSVGSAAVYLLRMLAIKGCLTLIDHDVVKIENLNRSPLFGFGDVGRCKVHTAQQYLHSQVPTRAFIGTYSDFICQHSRQANSVDLILPFANEFGVRSAIENNFPPVQVYGTTFDWGINYHHHISLIDDCSLCRFPEDVPVPTICSTTQIEVIPEERIDAALPFASVGAAALTIAGLIRLQFPDYLNSPNFACIDFKGNLSHVLSYRRRPQPQCLCSSRSRAIHRRFIHETKFYSFSRS